MRVYYMSRTGDKIVLRARRRSRIVCRHNCNRQIGWIIAVAPAENIVVLSENDVDWACKVQSLTRDTLESEKVSQRLGLFVRYLGFEDCYREISGGFKGGQAEHLLAESKLG